MKPNQSIKPEILVQNWPVAQLPGLSQEHQLLLVQNEITCTGDLLKKGQTPAERLALANQLQIHVQYVNKWVALADLARIPSVGCEYCGLLLHAGIASVAQLAVTPLPRLHQQVVRLQVATLRRRDLSPPLEVVKQWIQEAQGLMRKGAGGQGKKRGGEGGSRGAGEQRRRGAEEKGRI